MTSVVGAFFIEHLLRDGSAVAVMVSVSVAVPYLISMQQPQLLAEIGHLKHRAEWWSQPSASAVSSLASQKKTRIAAARLAFWVFL